MARAIVWITGASGGIGLALARCVPWDDARVIGISRRPVSGIEHIKADLADPASWQALSASFIREVNEFSGERVVFIHAAGTIDPIGFAGEVESAAYRANVILNSAAPQVLGHEFLSAVRDMEIRRDLLMLTSGASKTIYPGWSSYGAGKAAVDQWCRNAGAEQSIRGGTRILAVAPGIVDTAMQEKIRLVSYRDFPRRAKFTELHARGQLGDPFATARRIWDLLDSDLDSGVVVDLRDLPGRD